MRSSRFLALFFLFGSLPVLADDAREKFFETQIRPLLAKRCFECHGEKKQESGVRLDRRIFVYSAGSDTTLLAPGKPEESRIWGVTQYDELDVQMPPSGKLPAAELALLKVWIEQGAYWPDDGPAPVAANGESIPRKADGSYDFAAAVTEHWAYRPIEPVSVPPAPPGSSCRTSIDQFIAATQATAGLEMSPLASRETLIRRLSMDLLGVPPTYEQVQAFVNDQSPGAIDRLVDEYLGSPLYGQRWARHWLDVARYADTKGYVFTENRFYPYSYTYRDYVVRSLNEDLPYDRFILEQLAADQLGLEENDPRLAALGFLTVGPRFLNREPDIIDDRIDLVGRGLMGMTIACARCHDHKFDPIPTTDYYSLYGVFNSSYEPEEPPLIGAVDSSNPKYQAFAAELAKRQKELDDYCATQYQQLVAKLTDNVADCLPAVAKSLDLIPKDAKLETPHGEQRVKIVQQWKTFLQQQLKAKNPVFLPWGALMAAKDTDLAQGVDAKLRPLLDNPQIPAVLKKALRQNPPHSRLEVANLYGKVLHDVVEEWKTLQAQQPAPTHLADSDRDSLRQILFGTGSVSDVAGGEKSPLFERDQHDHIRRLNAKINDWNASSPDAPPRAMVLLDKDKPVNPVVFQRGDPRRRGQAVTRHAPRILTPKAEQPFKEGSGRLALAREIASPENPLTARVIVNRVWSYHFGEGLVATASDFGLRSAPPTNLDLLNYLAWTFVHEDHWSLKSLHRRILLSHAYLQSSVDRPAARKIDPDNHLLWRQNRQRLEFETMRDSLLAVAGTLDEELSGRPVSLEKDPDSNRRTIYSLIDRNNLPGLFRTFDFPSPDSSSPGRPLTTVPQQALFAMNSDFVQRLAQKLAQNVRNESSETSQQATLLVQNVFSRKARPEEVDLLSKYLESHPLDQLAQALLMTNEFMFVD